ncbi:MAG: Hpt domain-containing protein [Lachnospiraceae bacterium]|nr:Hpt domain-containing protein [Lachnospiraceae bacterium]
MEFDLTLLSGSGLDIKTGLDYMGSKDRYIAALQRFCKSHDKNAATVREYLAARDYESYMVTVHALKSNSRMIGAMELGKSFETLEMAAREKNIRVIEKDTASVLARYDDLYEKLSPIAAEALPEEEKEISEPEAKECIDGILQAIDDFDDRRAKELIKKLSGYPFEESEAEKLQTAGGYIDDFMYDEAAEVISSISLRT